MLNGNIPTAAVLQKRRQSSANTIAITSKTLADRSANQYVSLIITKVKSKWCNSFQLPILQKKDDFGNMLKDNDGDNVRGN
jgi:hypothetical protein